MKKIKFPTQFSPLSTKNEIAFHFSCERGQKNKPNKKIENKQNHRTDKMIRLQENSSKGSPSQKFQVKTSR